MPSTETVTQLLSVLTAIGDGMVVVLAISLVLFGVFKKRLGALGKLVGFVSTNALTFSLVVATIATMGSLFFSEVAHFEPCKLCWIQRIFMYPLVLILGIATWRNDRGIADYVLPLSVVGAGFAGYHYALQVNPNLLAPCSVVGYSVSCAERFVTSFGYITIPMMSLTAFLMITLFLASARVADRRLRKTDTPLS